jgi:hypothetical protein
MRAAHDYGTHSSHFRRTDMATNEDRVTTGRDLNEDPITGEPGSHPVGAGVGAAVGGAAAGAAVGAVAGPVGTVAGTIIGGIAGGLAGKGIAERIDPTQEEHFWRNEYPRREYYDPTIGYPEVGPAYRYGWESRAANEDRDWDDVEPELGREWANRRGDSSLDWERARPASRDAWERVDMTLAEERDRQAASADESRQGPPRTPK